MHITNIFHRFKKIENPSWFYPIDLQTSFVLSLLFLFFQLFYINISSNTNFFYIMVGFLGFFTLPFLFDLVKNRWFSCKIYLFIIVFSFPCICVYSILGEESLYVNTTYMMCTFLITMILVDESIFPLCILYGVVFGVFLYILECGNFTFPKIGFFEISVYILQLMLSVVLWKFIYVNKNKFFKKREEFLKDYFCSINHETNTLLASLEISLSSINECVKNNESIEKLLLSIDRTCKIKKSISILLDIMKNNFIEDFVKLDLEHIDVLNEIRECVQEYPLEDDLRKNIIIAENSFFAKINKVLFKNVIFNLLKNAEFFIKKAKKGHIEIKIEQTKKHNVVSFKDTGVGIEPNDIDHIFDKFFSKRKNGSGLGLFFCKKVVEGFGGHITCQSVVGEFTEFFIFFPK